MKTGPTPLHCILLNCGTHLELHDEDLSSRQYEDMQQLLPPSCSALRLGDPATSAELRWAEQRPGWPAQFEIYRTDKPLLVAGLALDRREAIRLRGRFNLLRGTTFRCLQRPDTELTQNVPWLGILLMPGALELSDAQLDHLCGVGQTVAQVWFRRRFLKPAFLAKALPRPQ